jgi:hypothetical protein
MCANRADRLPGARAGRPASGAAAHL